MPCRPKSREQLRQGLETKLALEKVGILSEHMHDLEFLHDGKTSQIRKGDARFISKAQPKLVCLLETFLGDSFHRQQSKFSGFENAVAKPSCFCKRSARKQARDRLVKHIIGCHPKAAAPSVPRPQKSYLLMSRLRGIF